MRTLLSICVALTILLGSTTAVAASNGEIGLFFNPQGSECSKTVGCNAIETLYIYAILQGASAGGITTAEYALGLGPDYQKDDGWLFEEDFSPAANIVLGSAIFPLDVDGLHQDRLFRGRGVNVAFPRCQPGEGGLVLLQTVSVYNQGCETSEFPMLVISHDVGSNPFFQCPLFTLCDDPVFTKVCLGTDLTTCRNPRPPYAINATCSTSGRALVNPQGGASGDCEPTTVEESSWSLVKGMYR